MRHALRTLLAPNPSPMTLDGTRTYLVGAESPVVIDPGPHDERHLATILDALAGVRPTAIILTHGHADHAGAAAALAERTGGPIRVGPEWPAPETSARPIADDELIETDAGLLRAVRTPGHAPEHIAMHWSGPGAPPGGAIFVGDLMMGGGDTSLVAPPEGDLAAYLESLARVEALRPGVIHPAHGPPIEDPAAAIARYREHRRQRLEQLRTALAAHPDATPAALVDAIYGDSIDPSLRPQAAGSIAAMLDYLRRPPAPAEPLRRDPGE